MLVLLLVLLLALILAGAGFALHLLWWLAIIVLVIWGIFAPRQPTTIA